MDKALLRGIISEQMQWQTSLDKGVTRDNLQELAKSIHLPHTVVISGIRRAGKSTLLAQAIKEFYPGGVYYFNFEDERLLNFSVEDFNKLYEVFMELFGERRVFFFDEIQNVQGWEVFVRRMQETGFKFFITGSNASLLSKELGTKLTGRSVTQQLYPFSFKEFLRWTGVKTDRQSFLLPQTRATLKRSFNEYLRMGGMPEYLRYKDPVVLKRLYEDILYRDIVARYDIKDVKALRELGLYLLSNPGGLVTYNSLKKSLGLGSMNTVKSYMEYMENSFLLFTSNMFSYSLKQQLHSPKKIYCIDSGLMEAVAFQFSQNRGKFLENLVYLELKRRGLEIYYYKTQKNLEVDFLIKEGKKASALLQACLSLNDTAVRDREIKALTGAMDELNLDHAIILTEDTEEKIQIGEKAIVVYPVYQWLLEDKL